MKRQVIISLVIVSALSTLYYSIPVDATRHINPAVVVDTYF